MTLLSLNPRTDVSMRLAFPIILIVIDRSDASPEGREIG